MGKLEGKVALVTGSGRNIGRATVLKLAGEGAHVVVNSRSNQAEAEAVAREARGLGVEVGPLIDDNQRSKVSELVEDAVGRGAKAVVGGHARDGAGYFYDPTVLT